MAVEIHSNRVTLIEEADICQFGICRHNNRHILTRHLHCGFERLIEGAVICAAYAGYTLPLIFDGVCAVSVVIGLEKSAAHAGSTGVVKVPPLME